MQRALSTRRPATDLRNLIAVAAVIAGVVASEASAQAVQDRGRSAQTLAERTPLQWIQAIQQAAIRVNYSGTIVYQAGGEMRTSRITHIYDGTASRERVQTLDGKPREFIRLRTENNDEVRCLIPESRRVIIEHRAIDDPFPGMLGAPAEAILQHYGLKIGGIERVAGLQCRVIALEPLDSLRYGYRLCADRATALLLKAQTFNAQRQLIEQIAFTDLRIGERIDRAQLKPAWPTEGWTVERSEYRQIDLDKAGWSVPTPEGFRRTKEVARRIGTRDAMQVVFSDGLATVSVFIEPSAPGVEAGDTVLMTGPTAAYSRRVGEALITVVGEIPPVAVRSVANSVEFRPR